MTRSALAGADGVSEELDAELLEVVELAVVVELVVAGSPVSGVATSPKVAHIFV